VVLSELLANAVDHGVLGLDSRLKEGGMEALDTYFRLREQRLAVLSTGWVALEIRATDQAHILEIDVHDSGAGFDVQRSSGTAGSATGVAPARAGRGLDVLRNLCLRVAHLDGGTRTVATVSLPAMSPNIFKPTGTP
jgi:anti-sigma regulatory factor (Ser/Thr protein kinase)